MGYFSVGMIKVFGVNINWSLFVYFVNFEEERVRYNISIEDDGFVEKDLMFLKFECVVDEKVLGVLMWFFVYGILLLGNNIFIVGDNKGVVVYLFEKLMRGENLDFVVGFS